MRCRAYLTEMTLASPLPRTTQLWLSATLLLAGLYGIRAVTMETPPQDHVALSLLLCALLVQVAMSLDTVTLKISLAENRCRVLHQRMGKRHERSLPVSVIHSAHLEFEAAAAKLDAKRARIVLITSLGMIPVSEKYQENPSVLDRSCRQINEFLASQERYLHA